MSGNTGQEIKPLQGVEGTIQRVRHVSDLGGYYIIAVTDKKISSFDFYKSGDYVILGTKGSKHKLFPISLLFERSEQQDQKYEIGDDVSLFLDPSDFWCN